MEAPTLMTFHSPSGAAGAKRIPFERRQSEVPPLRMRHTQACLKRWNGKDGNWQLSEYPSGGSRLFNFRRSVMLHVDGAHQQADWTFSEAAEIHILL